MKILIPTIGSRGDVQPFIALAQGLNQAGHSTTVASHPVMRSLVESHQVTFKAIGPDINLGQRVAEIRSRARNTAMGLIQAMRFGFEMLERSHQDILDLGRQSDLIVVPTSVAAGKNEAELLGLPYLSVSLMPWAIPWEDPERPLLKRILYKSIDGLVHLITTRPLNRIRKKQGLSPVGREGFTSPRLNLIPVSPVIFPPNPHWDPCHQLVGYWFTQSQPGWRLPEELALFLSSGEPPVLISLGAMSLGDQGDSEIIKLLIDAIQLAGVRAVIQGWKNTLEKMKLPPGIIAARPLPHDRLLPQCAGIVHHGGYGTTAAGLRAGIPALVIPHIADQFYWGQKVFELGIGPKPIRRTELKKSAFVKALGEIIENQEYRKAASRLGETVRAEDGVGNAVRLIENAFLDFI